MLLGVSTNVASSLVPDEWAKRHALWVWIAFGACALLTVWLAVIAARGGNAAPVDRSIHTHAEAGHVEVATEGATVDRSTRIEGTSGTTVIAGDGSTVVIGSPEAQPAPRQQEGQIIVGDLPGAPPAFVEREAVNRIAAVFAGGGRVAAVSAVTGGRGTGKLRSPRSMRGRRPPRASA